MLYPLSSVHKLIYENLHPETISQRDQPNPVPDVWRLAEQEIETSRLHLFAQLNQANGTDCLKVIVYTCQAGYVSLINRLRSYIAQPEPYFTNEETELTTRTRYRAIRKTLIAHLNELYRYYAPFFDAEQKVPRFVVNSKQSRIKNKLLHIRKQLMAPGTNPSLLSIIDLSIVQMIDYKQPNLTYKQLYYIDLLLTELDGYCATATSSAETTTLTDFLIRMNFNDPKFITHITEQLREQITDDMSLPEQSEKWAFHVKEFQQITTATPYSLYPQRQPVKECLIHAAEQELAFIKQKISFLPSIQSVPLPTQREKKVVTHLTVSQLGVFARLLVDCKMIEHTNQTELLKLIAGCLTTTKTAQISAESLRVRYYNPDRASIAITKEYLLQMIQRLSTY